MDKQTSGDTEGAGIWGDSLGAISHIKHSQGLPVSLLVGFPEFCCPSPQVPPPVLQLFRHTLLLARLAPCCPQPFRQLLAGDSTRLVILGAAPWESPFSGCAVERAHEVSEFGFITCSKRRRCAWVNWTWITLRKTLIDHERLKTPVAEANGSLLQEALVRLTPNFSRGDKATSLIHWFVWDVSQPFGHFLWDEQSSPFATNCQVRRFYQYFCPNHGTGSCSNVS